MKKCTGTRWRYRNTTYIAKNGDLCSTTRLSLLKSMSCDGLCDQGECCQAKVVPPVVRDVLSDCVDLLPLIPAMTRDQDLLKLVVDCWDDDTFEFRFVKV